MAAGPQDVRLYEAQQKIYPREVSGRFNTLRVIAVCALLGLFYALPWLQWEGHQAILFDLPIEQRFAAAMKLLGIDPMMLAGEAGHA